MTAPLPYHELHPGQGPHVLMVHGMLSSRAQWEPNLPALRRVCTPVVVELFGHGRSPAPTSTRAYHPDYYVRCFEALRASLGIEQWPIIGQSLGAALTLRYALDHPERVSAHLLTNSNSAFADEGWASAVRPGMQALLERARQEGLAALERLPIHPRHSRRLPETAKERLLADARLHDPVGVALTGRETVPHSPLGGRLGSNRVPSLLLCGTRERRFAPLRQTAEREMPKLEVIAVDAGHAVNLEAQEAFDGAATAFVARHASIDRQPSPLDAHPG